MHPVQQVAAAAAAAAAVQTPTMVSGQPSLSGGQAAASVRLRKRQSSNWLQVYEEEMLSKEVEWANPCGGVYVNRHPSRHQRPPIKKILRKLQNVAGREYKTLNLTTPAIDIRDIRMWLLHENKYKFLPFLKLNSNVALRRWHRHVQLFVASFSYLRRAQLHWDYHRTLQESGTAKELRTLRSSARKILCEIEIAINSTSAQVGGRASGGGRRLPLAVKPIRRANMERRLRFQTPLKHISPLRAARPRPGPPLELNPIDLKFVKSRYFTFLRSMVRILRANTKRPGQAHLGGLSFSAIFSESGSAERLAPRPAPPSRRNPFRRPEPE